MFYILASGLLRNVLKECISTPDSKIRKAAIEKAYKWHREKRRILLETLNVLYSKPTVNQKQDADDDRFLYQSDDERKPSIMPITVNVNDFSRLEKQEPPLFVNLEKQRQIYIQDKLKQYSRRNLEATLFVREQIKTEKVLETKNSDNRMQGSSSSSNDRLKQKWMQSRLTDRLEKTEDMERKEVLTRWSFNKARKEEEIHRRLESAKYSSQTGNRVHTIVKDKDLRREQERRMMKQKSLQAKLNDVNFLNSSSDEEEDMIIEDDFEPYKPSGRENRPESALSPYSNREAVKQSIFEDVEYYTESDQQFATSKGLIRPKSGITNRRPSTVATGHSLSSAKAAIISATTPLSAPPARPATAIVTFNPFEIFSDERKKKEEEEKARLAAEAAKKAKEEGDSKDKKKGAKGGKGAKKEAPKKPPGKGKKDEKSKDEADEVKLPPQPKLLASGVRTVPPSAFLNEQLDNCEKIQLNLARNGFDVPFSLITRSLVHPEDAPYSECIAKLPTPTGSLLNDVVKPKKGKKKATKKKTKKKK